jgi:chorismate mutase/prephenate dehydratase
MANIKELRREIDELDEQILRFLADRVKVCEAIGSAKKTRGLPVRDLEREKEIYKRVREQAANLGLNPIQVETVYHEIVNMCSAVQE